MPNSGDEGNETLDTSVEKNENARFLEIGGNVGRRRRVERGASANEQLGRLALLWMLRPLRQRQRDVRLFKSVEF